MPDGNEFEQLKAAQSAASYWIALNGETSQVSAEELKQKVADGYDGPVLRIDDPDQTWKKAADYGVTAPPPAPPAAPAAPEAPPAAPAAPEAPPAAPAAPEAPPAAPATPATPATPAATSSNVPATLEVDDEQAMALLNALNLPSEGGDSYSLASIAEEVDAAGAMSHSYNFSVLRKGSWETSSNSLPQEIAEAVPVGSRPYHGVYLAHRVGATAWKGQGKASKGGDPPLWRAVIPHPRILKDRSTVLVQKVLSCGKKVQFTSKDDRVKFDHIGRITPEIQILIWRPDTGFFLLCASGYKTTVDSLEALKPLEAQSQRTVIFSINEQTVENKKVKKENPDADNASWEEYCIHAAIDTGSRSEAIFKAYRQFYETDQLSIARELSKFLSGQDFTGLTPDALQEKLAGYDQIS